jgi:hypothetical protein
MFCVCTYIFIGYWRQHSWYRLHCWGIKIGFLAAGDWLWNSPSLPFSGYQGILGVKQRGHETDHLPVSSGKVQSEWYLPPLPGVHRTHQECKYYSHSYTSFSRHNFKKKKRFRWAVWIFYGCTFHVKHHMVGVGSIFWDVWHMVDLNIMQSQLLVVDQYGKFVRANVVKA